MNDRHPNHSTDHRAVPDTDVAPVLSSGKPFPKNPYNGLPIFPPGVQELGMALVELDPHPLEKHEPFGRPLFELDLVPAFALQIVAARIDQLRKERKLKHRPRFAEIRRMAIEAMQADRTFQSELDAIFGRPGR
jgi:hypothetical protein